MTKKNTAVTPTVTEPLLDHLDIELTERCFFSCEHCYIRRDSQDLEAAANEMSPEFIFSLLKQAVALGCQSVRFTGGEPLIRPDFALIYEMAYDLGLKISVSTNAVLLSETIADLFAAKPPQDITVSIYGWNENSWWQTIGCAGMSPRVKNGLVWLTKRGLPFKLRYPPTKFLVANLNLVIQAAKDLGFEGELPWAWELTLHARRDPEANQRILACRMDQHTAAIQRLREPGLAERAIKIFNEKRPIKMGRLFNCRAAKKRLTIDAYGRLQLCLEVRLPETTFDLHRGTLAQAITEHLPPWRERMITGPEVLARCGRCRLKPICPVCPACAWMENGDLESVPEYHCEVIHAQAVILGLLPQGQKGWED